MTKRRNDLVLEGAELKARIYAAQIDTRGYVHTDWLRFTVYRRFAPIPTAELLFPQVMSAPIVYADDVDVRERVGRMVRQLRELPDADYDAGAQAFQLAQDVVHILGPDFSVDVEPRKGKDFYRFRLDILRKGHPVGWVGFLSTSAGARGEAQNNTLHVNLEGMACTFAQSGWREPMADYIDQHRGLITRIDLAVDFFDGIEGGMERFPCEYLAGLMDHLGQRPGHDQKGTWSFNESCPNKGRSFYLGTRESGKLTNIYEKGLQLFGFESANPWVRAELRYGNQKRVLPTDMLRRPGDFFAGASEWHAALLREHGAQAFPEPVPCEQRLPVQTIEAECERSIRWFLRTAGASAVLAFLHMSKQTLLTLLDNESNLPGRLRKFQLQEVQMAYQRVSQRLGTGRPGLAFA